MFDRELAKKIQKDWRHLPAAKSRNLAGWGLTTAQKLSMDNKKAPSPHELGILKPFQKQDHVVTVHTSPLEYVRKEDGALVAAKNKEKPAVSARKYASTSLADLEVPKTVHPIFRTSPGTPVLAKSFF